MNVQTAIGDIDINLLQVVDLIKIEANARITATEWRFEGQIVRRDLNINILRGQSMTGEQEGI